MSILDRHTIRVRYHGGTHQAIDDKSWRKCTSTSGHRQAAEALLKKQGIAGTVVRMQRLESGLHDANKKAWEQWQVYIVKATTSKPQ